MDMVHEMDNNGLQFISIYTVIALLFMGVVHEMDNSGLKFISIYTVIAL